MSVQHSPSKKPITYTDSNEANTARSESQPDLRQLALSDRDIRQVTHRKRKQPEDDLSEKFDKFEQKIMSVLNGIAQNQSEKLDKISHEVSSITGQINQLQTTTSQLAAEQNKYNQELANIDKFKISIEQKIQNISLDLGNLKKEFTKPNYDISTLSMADHSTFPMSHEDMIFEIQERSRRERNIILSGISEVNSKDPGERLGHDKQEVTRIIKLAYPNCPEPIKVMRLGKYSGDKCRPIKACLPSADAAKFILRNKSSISRQEVNIKCYSDQTPIQRKVLQETRTELKRRTDAGEQDLTIKYIKGIPKVIQAHAKNDPAQKTMSDRSIEVWLKTGRRHSDILAEQKLSEGQLRRPGATIIFWLKCEQAIHDERLNARVDSMIEEGLIQELLDFHDKHNKQRIQDGKPPDYTKGIFQTLGFKEFHDYLMLSDEERNSDAGKKLLKQSIENMKMSTRRYARRQNKMIRGRFLEHPAREVPPIYELDTTDISKWDNEVKNKAIHILDSFLNESPCDFEPLTPNIDDMKREVDRNSHNYCDVCNRIFIGDNVYAIHLKSIRHKKVLKKKKLLEEQNSKMEERNPSD